MLLLYLLFSFTVNLNAENIRGKLVSIQKVPASANEDMPSFQTLLLEQLVACELPEDISLLEGIMLEIQVPRIFIQYRGALVLHAYQDISPKPALNNPAYTGKEAFLVALPAMQTFFYQIPIRKNHSLRKSPTLWLANPILKASFPLIISLMPVMKGLPSKLDYTAFKIRLKPIFRKKGLLILLNKDGSPFSHQINIKIDKNDLPYQTEGILLNPGLHELEVSLPALGSFKQIVEIEIGKKAIIQPEFKTEQSAIKIDVPEEARVFLDGKDISGNKYKLLQLSPGEHNILFHLGEYQISRRFALKQGEKKLISLDLNILIQDFTP